MAVAYRTNVKPRTVRLTNSILKTKVKFGNQGCCFLALSSSPARPTWSLIATSNAATWSWLSPDRNKKKIGKVLKVHPKEGKVVVEGVNIVTRHVKAKNAYVKGGIIKEEAPNLRIQSNALQQRREKACPRRIPQKTRSRIERQTTTTV